MPCHKKKVGRGKGKTKVCTKRKKVILKHGKRYYKNKSGLVKLRWNEKPPRRKR